MHEIYAEGGKQMNYKIKCSVFRGSRARYHLSQPQDRGGKVEEDGPFPLTDGIGKRSINVCVHSNMTFDGAQLGFGQLEA